MITDEYIEICELGIPGPKIYELVMLPWQKSLIKCRSLRLLEYNNWILPRPQELLKIFRTYGRIPKYPYGTY